MSESHTTRWLPPTGLAEAIQRLRAKIEYTTVGFQLLPSEFTLSELQAVYEAILGRALDKRNFRKRVEQLEVVVALDRWRTGSGGPRGYMLFRRGRSRLS